MKFHCDHDDDDDFLFGGGRIDKFVVVTLTFIGLFTFFLLIFFLSDFEFHVQCKISQTETDLCICTREHNL